MAVAFGRGCGFASGRLLGGNLTPDGILLEGEANFSLSHEAHPKTTLYGVVFQKLNGPLLTSIRGPVGCRELRVVRQLERPDAMRGELVSLKDALHRSQAHACAQKQRLERLVEYKIVSSENSSGRL
jgi:hypothetical protein